MTAKRRSVSRTKRRRHGATTSYWPGDYLGCKHTAGMEHGVVRTKPADRRIFSDAAALVGARRSRSALASQTGMECRTARAARAQRNAARIAGAPGCRRGVRSRLSRGLGGVLRRVDACDEMRSRRVDWPG